VIGEVIGNFRIVKRLGSGGMGEVFLAEHKDLQTPVAVKLLNKDISGNHDHVQRFFNEARVVSKIKSAGIVKIFDSGFFKDQAYLIMELLDGESLASRIKRGPLPGPQVLDIARQVASVLDATHRQSVTHRDLKPDNIYIVHDDERTTGERVKILDFGIAKLSGTLAVASPKTSGTMGTPAYMAPEQWGDSSQVDWRADAYSLGCVMFEMVCGRPPFQPTNIAEAFMMHATKEPPAPSSLVSGVTPELEALILRLLSKEPGQRTSSMGHLTRELAEQAGEKHSSQPSIAISQPAIVVPPTSEPVAIAPTVPIEERPAAVSNTTLGGSAAALEASPPKKRSFALFASLAVAAVVGAVALVGGNDAKPTASPATATETGSASVETKTKPPVETKPVETKPVETKPAETKPAETTPTVETTPVVETKTKRGDKKNAALETDRPRDGRRRHSIDAGVPVTTQAPVETKPVETKPVETKPAETKPPPDPEPDDGTVQQLGGPNQNNGRRRRD